VRWCTDSQFGLRFTLLRSLLVCSTPDYITPEMPQPTHDREADKVGKLRFFFVLFHP
jgi:hypothetical protein